MRHISRIVLIPVVFAALALLPRVSRAQQQSESCTQALPFGYPVPAGYHVHQHDDHIHLCQYVQARPAQPARQPAPSPAAAAYLQQRIQKAQEDYQSCVRDRASMTSGVIRAGTNCEQWLTIIQQLQASLRQAQGSSW